MVEVAGDEVVAAEPDGGDPTRRSVLQIGTLLGAGAVAVACAPPAPETPASGGAGVKPPGPPPAPPSPPVWAGTTGLHTARRLTWGATPALSAEIDRRGLVDWLDEQLDWRSIDDSHVAPMLTPWPRPDRDAAAVRDDKSWRLPGELAVHEALRRCFSERQLHEVMVDFWFDHFNVDSNHAPARYHLGVYDKAVIRPHALGRFSDLLPAVGAHPAMLHYLDQANSRADRGRTPNENYARELMELHTVGSGAGYTEDDVKGVAHLLSGWSTDGNAGGFVFRSDRHDPGPMTSTRQVLGWSRGALAGEAAGRAFLNHLAHHPATARRVCHKLARRLVGEHVAADSPLVDRAVAAYQSSGTDMAVVVRKLVLSGEFGDSAGAKVRRPQSLVTQMVRALGLRWVEPNRPDDFMWAYTSRLDQLGNANHGWPAPNGYPDANGFWLSVGSLVSRWNLAVWVAYGTVAGMPFDAEATMDWAPSRRWGDWLDAMALAITGEPWPPAVRASVLSHHGVTESTQFRSWDHHAARPIVAVLLQTAGFQRS